MRDLNQTRGNKMYISNSKPVNTPSVPAYYSEADSCIELVPEGQKVYPGYELIGYASDDSRGVTLQDAQRAEGLPVTS